MRRAGVRLVVYISEAGAPVAEVRAYNEDGGGVGEVGCEDLAETAFGGCVGRADHYGDEGRERHGIKEYPESRKKLSRGKVRWWEE